MKNNYITITVNSLTIHFNYYNNLVTFYYSIIDDIVILDKLIINKIIYDSINMAYIWSYTSKILYSDIQNFKQDLNINVILRKCYTVLEMLNIVKLL